MSNNIWNNEYNPFNKWKVLAWHERLMAIKEGKFLPPVNIALDLIQGTQQKKACGGFSCNFCMSDLDDSGRAAVVPRDVALAMPEFFAGWGVKSLCLAGHHSDTLLYHHETLREFLYLCQRWGVEVGLVCNGACFTQDMIETVARTCKWSGWSINAGLPDTHSLITGTETFDKIVKNIKNMSTFVRSRQLPHNIGYKFLITDDNYNEILAAVKVASEVGVRHFQIRPAELSLDRVMRIDSLKVERDIQTAIERYERRDFEIFGIREKFKPDFTKKCPKRCIASPLGSTWKADGDIVICPDRRWSRMPNMVLANYIEEGLDAIRNIWGGPQHKKIIEEANKNLDTCIRCTSYHWHEIYENAIEKDMMDVSLI